MIIYRQKMYGAFPASWGKELIAKAKKGLNWEGGNYTELRKYRKSLKTADPLVNRQKYVKDLEKLDKIYQGDRRYQMTGKDFRSNPFNDKVRNATPINRDPQKWEKLADKSRETNKNWRVEQARRDQEAKYQDAQKRIAKQDQQAQSQQKSKGGFGGFISHVFGR